MVPQIQQQIEAMAEKKSVVTARYLSVFQGEETTDVLMCFFWQSELLEVIGARFLYSASNSAFSCIIGRQR